MLFDNFWISLGYFLFRIWSHCLPFEIIDTVNQGIWSLLIKLRLEQFVIVKKCKQYAKILTY